MVDYELGYQGGHQGDDLLSPMAWLLSSPFFSLERNTNTKIGFKNILNMLKSFLLITTNRLW